MKKENISVQQSGQNIHVFISIYMCAIILRISLCIYVHTYHKINLYKHLTTHTHPGGCMRTNFEISAKIMINLASLIHHMLSHMSCALVIAFHMNASFLVHRSS